MSIDSLEIVGVDAPGNEILSPAKVAKKQVYLPMRSTATTTEWQFIYKQRHLAQNGIDDVVSFTYESIPYFASEECGASYRYRVTGIDYSTHVIDSVVMPDSLITNADKVSILIYFRTAAPEGATEK